MSHAFAAHDAAKKVNNSMERAIFHAKHRPSCYSSDNVWTVLILAVECRRGMAFSRRSNMQGRKQA